MISAVVLVTVLSAIQLLFNFWLFRAWRSTKSTLVGNFFKSIWFAALMFLASNLAYIGWRIGSTFGGSAFYSSGLDIVMDVFQLLGGLIGTAVAGVLIANAINDIRQSVA
jgi:hypothetical protein